jgi:hypothetical protein
MLQYRKQNLIISDLYQTELKHSNKKKNCLCTSSHWRLYKTKLTCWDNTDLLNQRTRMHVSLDVAKEMFIWFMEWIKEQSDYLLLYGCLKSAILKTKACSLNSSFCVSRRLRMLMSVATCTVWRYADPPSTRSNRIWTMEIFLLSSAKLAVSMVGLWSPIPGIILLKYKAKWITGQDLRRTNRLNFLSLHAKYLTRYGLYRKRRI